MYERKLEAFIELVENILNLDLAEIDEYRDDLYELRDWLQESLDDR